MRITNKLALPQPFVDAATEEHTYTPKQYSVTSLLNGIRQNILMRRHDDEIEKDVSEMLWLIFGKAVHKILEEAKETNDQLKENKVVIEMPNGYKLSGIFDLYDDSTGTVTDYKTATVWKAIFGEYDDYRSQLLGYCWQLQQIGFDAHRGEIVMMLKDHSKPKAMREKDYPQIPVKPLPWEFTEGEIDDWGMWAQHRFEEIEAAEQLPDDQLPLCTPEERWHKPDKWAVKKKGNKKAQKLFDNKEDAVAYMELQERGSKYQFEVESRPGTDAKCLGYCDACEFCDHYKAIIASQVGEAA